MFKGHTNFISSILTLPEKFVIFLLFILELYPDKSVHLKKKLLKSTFYETMLVCSLFDLKKYMYFPENQLNTLV